MNTCMPNISPFDGAKQLTAGSMVRANSPLDELYYYYVQYMPSPRSRTPHARTSTMTSAMVEVLNINEKTIMPKGEVGSMTNKDSITSFSSLSLTTCAALCRNFHSITLVQFLSIEESLDTILLIRKLGQFIGQQCRPESLP